MYCAQCGGQIRDGSKFCSICGTEIQPDSPVERKKVSITVKKNSYSADQSSVKPVKRIRVNMMNNNETINEQTRGSASTTNTLLPVSNSFGSQTASAVQTTSVTAMNNDISPSFYIIDFFKKLFRVKNLGVLIYLLLNLVIITFVLVCLQPSTLGSSKVIYAFLEAILLYGVSLSIALSPIGEWILRFQNGCKSLKRQDQIDYLVPLFDRVYKKAKTEDPLLSNNVQLFIMEDDVPNAFATGRRTVCVTTGLLKLRPEKIEGALAHEFGHLSHHDTDLLLLVSVGNFVITAIILALRIAIWALYLISNMFLILLGGWDGVIGVAINTFLRFLSDVTISILALLWTKAGILLCMHSSRGNEFEADKFAFDLGYGNELCSALDTICGPGAKGLFATLVSSHPDKSERIAKLQSYGATYRAQVGIQYGIK